MVFGEVTLVPQAPVELGPTVIIRVDLLGRCGHHVGAGDGGVPAHAPGDDDVDPAQQRGGDGGSGLTVGERIGFSGGQCW